MGGTMNAAPYVGRVGGLAVALGVGAAVATGPGVAWAETSSPSSSAPPSSSGSSSMRSPASSGSDSAPDTSGSVEPLVSGPKQTSKGSTTSPVTSAKGSPSGTTSTSSETASAPAGPGMVASTGGAHTSSTTIRPSADTNSGSRGNHDLLNGGGDPGGDLRPVRHPKPSSATAPAALPKPSTSTTSQPTDSQQVPESAAGAAPTEPPTTPAEGSALASAHDTRASTPVPTLGTPIRTAKVVAVEGPVDTLQQRSADRHSDPRYAVTPAAVTTMSSTAALRAAPVTTAQAVAPVAAAKPLTPLGIVSGVVSSVLGPLANNTPVAPAQPPALSVVLAWARREFERTFSTSGKTGAAGNSAVAAAAVTPTVAAVVATPTTPSTRPRNQEIGGPITITTGGTYTGWYQSNNNAVPAVTISTTQPVTLSRVHIIAKGVGVWAYDTKGTRLTIVDSVFEQIDPGAVVNHRAVEVDQPASFVFEHNQLIDTDGVEIHGLTSLQVNPLRVNYNLAINIGRYPHPTDGNCCVQFVQMDHVVSPDGQVLWNHTRNLPGQSGVEDNISFYVSGGTDSAHRIDVGHNLIDGAYSRDLSITNFTGGGINLGDGGGGSGIGGGGWNYAHDNVVVSTTNYGISVNGPNNYATNNVLINDGAEQTSSFGQAIVAWPEVSPAGLHSTGSNYNWRRSTTDATHYPCYVNTYCSGTQVSTTEQQARDAWEASRAAAGVTIGPETVNLTV